MSLVSWFIKLLGEKNEIKSSTCKLDCKFCTDMEDKYYNFPPYDIICQPSCRYCNPQGEQ